MLRRQCTAESKINDVEQVIHHQVVGLECRKRMPKGVRIVSPDEERGCRHADEGDDAGDEDRHSHRRRDPLRRLVGGGQLGVRIGDRNLVRVGRVSLGGPRSGATTAGEGPQADRSLDRSQGGLGIGLSLVQHLVELHRGDGRRPQRCLARGSEFTVRLPVLLSPEGQAPAAPARPAEQAARGGRVLVVDDNEDSADMFAKLLKRSGHDVRTAYTGPAALKAAAAHLPDVVLLDIGLPGINGYEVARRLRLLPQLKGVKLIAMTGYGQDTDRQLNREAGFDTHLTKPVDFLKVQELLTTLLKLPGSSSDDH